MSMIFVFDPFLSGPHRLWIRIWYPLSGDDSLILCTCFGFLFQNWHRFYNLIIFWTRLFFGRKTFLNINLSISQSHLTLFWPLLEPFCRSDSLDHFDLAFLTTHSNTNKRHTHTQNEAGVSFLFARSCSVFCKTFSSRLASIFETIVAYTSLRFGDWSDASQTPTEMSLNANSGNTQRFFIAFNHFLLPNLSIAVWWFDLISRFPLKNQFALVNKNEWHIENLSSGQDQSNWFLLLAQLFSILIAVCVWVREEGAR